MEIVHRAKNNVIHITWHGVGWSLLHLKKIIIYGPIAVRQYNNYIYFKGDVRFVE